MKRTYSIITTCKGRLDQLKVSLPRMVDQDGAEVIVVDYDCPERTGDYVRHHFPTVRVVAVEGEPFFSNWKARNLGAAAARSDVLVFCDADTVLAPGAIRSVDERLPPRSYGHFNTDAASGFPAHRRLDQNQFRGFQVVPARAFQRIGGYDEVLEGYAAGGDTDLEDRLLIAGLSKHGLDPAIVEEFLTHDNQARFTHHKEPLQNSYSTGLIYRQLKRGVIGMTRKPAMMLEFRQRLYAQAKEAAKNLTERKGRTSLTVYIQSKPVGMPRQLGFEKGTIRTAIRVDVVLENPIEEIPE